MKKIDWQAVANQVRELFPNVVQIASYSNRRWILVFAEEPENFLGTFNPLVSLIRKHGLPIPLIVSEKFIQSSLDSYPLEFLDICSDYCNLYVAEDMLAVLTFENDDIRLQIERELKSKWLLTRLASLEFGKKPQHLYGVLKESFTSLLPVFKGFCQLNGNAVPKDVCGLLDALDEILHAEIKVFRFIAECKKAPSHELIGNLFSEYMRAIELCTDKIDSWK